MKKLIRKWLGIDGLWETIDAQGKDILDLRETRITKDEAEGVINTTILDHIAELKAYLKPASVPVEEPKQLVKRPRTWSSFRGSVEIED